jgi:hypothetical protein
MVEITKPTIGSSQVRREASAQLGSCGSRVLTALANLAKKR